MERSALTGHVIGAGMKVQRVLGAGYLESVYLRALARELELQGIAAVCHEHIQVLYEGVVVGDFVADMLVEGCVLVELKAVRALAPTHEAQIVNYLVATGIEIGLLLNFGAERLEFRRKTRTYRRPGVSADEQENCSTGLQDGQDGVVGRERQEFK